MRQAAIEEYAYLKELDHRKRSVHVKSVAAKLMAAPKSRPVSKSKHVPRLLWPVGTAAAASSVPPIPTRAAVRARPALIDAYDSASDEPKTRVQRPVKRGKATTAPTPAESEPATAESELAAAPDPAATAPTTEPEPESREDEDEEDEEEEEDEEDEEGEEGEEESEDAAALENEDDEEESEGEGEGEDEDDEEENEGEGEGEDDKEEEEDEEEEDEEYEEDEEEGEDAAALEAESTPRPERRDLVALSKNELEETIRNTRAASARSRNVKQMRNVMKRARLAIMHLTQSRDDDPQRRSVSVSTSTASLGEGLSEEVRAALCELCERADGCIVQLHDLSKRLTDAHIIKLGGIPGEARDRKSKSNDKRKYISRLTTHLERIFDVVVKHNNTGKAVAGQSGFWGPYALSLRMID